MTEGYQKYALVPFSIYHKNKSELKLLVDRNQDLIHQIKDLESSSETDMHEKLMTDAEVQTDELSSHLRIDDKHLEPQNSKEYLDDNKVCAIKPQAVNAEGVAHVDTDEQTLENYPADHIQKKR